MLNLVVDRPFWIVRYPKTIHSMRMVSGANSSGPSDTGLVARCVFRQGLRLPNF